MGECWKSWRKGDSYVRNVGWGSDFCQRLECIVIIHWQGFTAKTPVQIWILLHSVTTDSEGAPIHVLYQGMHLQ